MSVNKHIYCYPFTDVGNAYINKTLQLWQSMGYAVKPCPRGLLQDWRIPRANKTIVLNWFEDWMLRSQRPAWCSLLWALLLLGVFSIMARNIVWVRHNYYPHDTQARSVARNILVFCLTRLAHHVVTHRPVADIASIVVPHPLVIDVAQLDPAQAPVVARDIEFIWFGMVREYKGLDSLLRLWPVDRKMLLLGKSSDAALSQRLLDIIAERRLNVEWQNRFIPDDELNQTLRRAKFVVLAHDDHTIIVSGAFYHAIACGANVVIRSSEFGRFAAAQHEYVHLLDLSVPSPVIDDFQYVPAVKVQRDATHHYGDSACRNAWAGIV